MTDIINRGLKKYCHARCNEEHKKLNFLHKNEIFRERSSTRFTFWKEASEFILLDFDNLLYFYLQIKKIL
jgi:hypothetical protein